MSNNRERDIIVSHILIPALQRLYKKDYFNIRIGVSERNICARLAHHMEIIMHENTDYMDYFADVEYNRKNDGLVKHFDNKYVQLFKHKCFTYLIQPTGW